MNPAETRNRSINFLGEGTLDALVIGGGIVGAGIARDAAMRGLRVGLVEQHDFAYGTSGRSSRLLHGGLRYLAQGRLGLVRESSIEKRVLHRIAPHLAEPLAFVFPSYQGAGWPPWQLRLGVKIYDLLCGGRNLGQSTWLPQPSVLKLIPQLEGNRLRGASRYFDALTNDARLVLDTLRSAARNNAGVINYLKFRNADYSGRSWTCELEDQLTGQRHTIKARAVVNATGPWAQKLPHSHVQLRLTKGVHVVVDRRRLPVPDAVVMTEGARILFAIPWAERVILGTTDTDYDGPIEAVRTQREDLTYLLRITAKFFPAAALTEADIISSWAGLRPLIASPTGRPSELSRAHQIRNPEPGWWDVAGGKLTTYRLMAQQAVDQIVRHLKLTAAPCHTAEEPLLTPEQSSEFSSIAPPAVAREAVEHFCAQEWVVHLSDVMLRRARWHYYCADASLKAEQVGQWMARLLDWPPERLHQELAAYREEAEWPANPLPHSKS